MRAIRDKLKPFKLSSPSLWGKRRIVGKLDGGGEGNTKRGTLIGGAPRNLEKKRHWRNWKEEKSRNLSKIESLKTKSFFIGTTLTD